jgi:predicted Fe-S protein YdhL (DUF1289 family)
MNTALHESVSLANSPCTGRCTTSMAPFDERCKGCGRDVDEIRDWETYSDYDKKIINIKNWLEGYNIRQRQDKINFMSVNPTNEKLKDIQGKLITIQALIEMVGQEIIDTYGKDPSIEDSYKSLFNSREKVLQAKQSLPHLD